MAGVGGWCWWPVLVAGAGGQTDASAGHIRWVGQRWRRWVGNNGEGRWVTDDSEDGQVTDDSEEGVGNR